MAGATVGYHGLDPDAQLGIIGDGGPPGGSGARPALIRHDLHEGDARGAVNADVDELPANAEMPVDRACPPSSDAMPHLD